MERRIVQVARVRAMDTGPGDVVNRDPEALDGWFQLKKVNHLHDGKLNLTDGGVENSFSVGPLDVVGLQLAKTATVEDQPELPRFRTAGAELDGDASSDDDPESETPDTFERAAGTA